MKEINKTSSIDFHSFDCFDNFYHINYHLEQMLFKNSWNCVDIDCKVNNQVIGIHDGYFVIDFRIQDLNKYSTNDSFSFNLNTITIIYR